MSWLNKEIRKNVVSEKMVFLVIKIILKYHNGLSVLPFGFGILTTKIMRCC